jgi:hypothetical protein
MPSDRLAARPRTNAVENMLLMALVVFACAAILEPFAISLERAWRIIQWRVESTVTPEPTPQSAVVPEQAEPLKSSRSKNRADRQPQSPKLRSPR